MLLPLKAAQFPNFRALFDWRCPRRSANTRGPSPAHCTNLARFKYRPDAGPTALGSCRYHASPRRTKHDSEETVVRPHLQKVRLRGQCMPLPHGSRAPRLMTS